MAKDLQFSVDDSRGALDPTNVNIRCPHCNRNGSFGGVGTKDVAYNSISKLEPTQKVAHARSAGMRVCPNAECKGLVFVIRSGGEQVLYTAPAEVLDFDGSNLPATILECLTESIKCHAAGCFRASAIMVRRTLEVVCDDKNAKGANLKDRITALEKTIVVPKSLLEAADELRILGNDAAHVESKEFDRIGKVEAELAIELAKELLKAVYQHDTLISRLRALKKTNSGSP